MRRPPSRQYYLLLITVVRVYCMLYAKMLKGTENEETRIFCQICVIGALQLRGAQALRVTPWLRLWFWDKIAPLSSFIKKNQSKIKTFFFQNVEDLSHVTWQFFETYKNYMTLLWRDTWSSLLLLTFVRVNPKLKKLQFCTRTTYWLCSHYIYHR